MRQLVDRVVEGLAVEHAAGPGGRVDGLEVVNVEGLGAGRRLRQLEAWSGREPQRRYGVRKPKLSVGRRCMPKTSSSKANLVSRSAMPMERSLGPVAGRHLPVWPPLPTVPSNRLHSDRFTRRVLAPARQTAAIRASASLVSRWERGGAFERHCVTLPVASSTRARHPHRLGPEGAGDLPFAVPVAIACRGTLAPGRSAAGRESRPVPPRTRPP
jgi:hypothetical protein